MPCSDGGYDAGQLDAIEKRQKKRDDKKRALEKAKQKRLDDVTRMLCTLANATENGGFGMVNDFGLTKEEKAEIVTWLKAHNAEDERRQRATAAAAKKKADAEEKKKTETQLKKAALDKLSAAERKALGL